MPWMPEHLLKVCVATLIPLALLPWLNLRILSRGEGITRQAFEQIYVGMTLAEAEGILGCPPGDYTHESVAIFTKVPNFQNASKMVNWIGYRGDIRISLDRNNKIVGTCFLPVGLPTPESLQRQFQVPGGFVVSFGFCYTIILGICPAHCLGGLLRAARGLPNDSGAAVTWGWLFGTAGAAVAIFFIQARYGPGDKLLIFFTPAGALAGGLLGGLIAGLSCQARRDPEPDTDLPTLASVA